MNPTLLGNVATVMEGATCKVTILNGTARKSLNLTMPFIASLSVDSRKLRFTKVKRQGRPAAAPAAPAARVCDFLACCCIWYVEPAHVNTTTYTRNLFFMIDLEDWLLCLVFAFTVVSIILLTLPSSFGAELRSVRPGKKSEIRVQVVVLGDIGRSPRIQYHALSIAKHKGFVDLIGYKGRASVSSVQSYLFMSSQYPTCILISKQIKELRYMV